MVNSSQAAEALRIGMIEQTNSTSREADIKA